MNNFNCSSNYDNSDIKLRKIRPNLTSIAEGNFEMIFYLFVIFAIKMRFAAVQGSANFDYAIFPLPSFISKASITMFAKEIPTGQQCLASSRTPRKHQAKSLNCHESYVKRESIIKCERVINPQYKIH